MDFPESKGVMMPYCARFPVLAGLISLAIGQFCGASAIPLGGTELDIPQEVSDLLEVRLRSPQVTDKNPSPITYTAPSLWLTNKLYGNKLILTWFAFRRPQDNKSQVRLIARPDLWRRYTYLERYRFLRNFGEAASSVGYHLLVLDRQNFPLAAHTCNFPQNAKPQALYPFEQKENPPKLLPKSAMPCKMWLNPIYGSSSF
jgi:hypothetical protein